MIIWTPRILRVAFVIFWYWPIPKWKIWKGYKPAIIILSKWPTIYLGPIKIITGPA